MAATLAVSVFCLVCYQLIILSSAGLQPQCHNYLMPHHWLKPTCSPTAVRLTPETNVFPRDNKSGFSNASKNLVHSKICGSPTTQSKFPWLAAVYVEHETGQWEQDCAGTLITLHIVLTAAHCVVHYTAEPVGHQYVKVGLGKLHRNCDKHEKNSIIINVRKIVVPEHYVGHSSFYALDIALLDLVSTTSVTSFIVPACIQWGDRMNVAPGTVGHAAGWGITKKRKPNEIAASTKLSYIHNDVCIARFQKKYQRYVTHDKFCAGSVNGSHIGKGHSGGGMTIAQDGQHFVVGVVSTRLFEEMTFSLFTDITTREHHSWLQEEMARLDRFKVQR